MQSSNDLPMEWVERIFMRLHGRFGNQFYDKFRTGQMTKNNEDAGIVNAKHTWASELAGISGERIKLALEVNYDYPPSCDDFKKNCVTAKIHPPVYQSLPAPNNKEANKEYAENVVSFVAENTKKTWRTDWVEFWEYKLRNPKQQSDIAIKYAKEALKNLGKERKTA